jgi:CDP-glucose 4,6-dehydratase
MRYLITGHTGFKGSWLALWLASRGHEVSGIALDPPAGGHFLEANIDSLMTHDFRVDIRDAAATREAMQSAEPDVVFHLAAQPLVRESYLDPRTTFETNAMGTLNVLEAVSKTPSVKAHVVITTDKVYRNVNQQQGYVEQDPLGGDDPYSSSKAMADILTQSWITSFPGAPTAIARGGNVIGGGDVSKDRLLPDLLRSFENGESTSIRFPSATRPWQHVLDCLNGYLTLSEALLAGDGLGEWNFGPGRESFVTVKSVADRAVDLWGDGASWQNDEDTNHPHEANLLALDAAKAERELGWKNLLPYPESLEWTVAWQKDVVGGSPVRSASEKQIAEFELRANGG